MTVTVTDNGTPSLSDSETFDVDVTKRATGLTYDGDTTADCTDVATLGATLIDAGTLAGLSGRTVGFTLGSQSTIADTDGSGNASTTLQIEQPTGPTRIGSSFEGDGLYTSSSDSDPLTITAEDSVSVESIGESFV